MNLDPSAIRNVRIRHIDPFAIYLEVIGKTVEIFEIICKEK